MTQRDATPEELALSIRDWCQCRSDGVSKQATAHIKAGGNFDDPQYRTLLGQSQAYMSVRSYIHGTVIALRRNDHMGDV